MQLLKKTIASGLIISGLIFWLMTSGAAIEYDEPTPEIAKAIAAAEADIVAAGAAAEEANKIALIKYLAEQGEAEWQHTLAVRYKLGFGIPKDRAKYLYWLEKAIDQNYVFAQLEMGNIYEAGDFVRQNKSTAKEWYGKACDGGYVYGCQSYRRLHEEGY